MSTRKERIAEQLLERNRDERVSGMVASSPRSTDAATNAAAVRPKDVIAWRNKGLQLVGSFADGRKVRSNRRWIEFEGERWVRRRGKPRPTDPPGTIRFRTSGTENTVAGMGTFTVRDRPGKDGVEIYLDGILIATSGASWRDRDIEDGCTHLSYKVNPDAADREFAVAAALWSVPSLPIAAGFYLIMFLLVQVFEYVLDPLISQK